MKTVYLYVLDTLSDWEPGYAIAELNSGRFFKEKGHALSVKTVAATKKPIKTMGGMTIVPDALPEDITPENTAALLLVGADTWPDKKHEAIIHKAIELLDAEVLVAAMCGATAPLALAGLFDDRAHTSNAPQYPELMNDFFKDRSYYKGYKGQSHYKEERAVADGNLVTASSAGPLLWAKYVIERLDVFSDEALEAWYKYFETGDAKYFFELMQALPQK